MAFDIFFESGELVSSDEDGSSALWGRTVLGGCLNVRPRGRPSWNS